MGCRQAKVGEALRTAIVPASALSAKDLRASHYVANPKRIAQNAVALWNAEQGGVLNLRGPAGKRLIELVEYAVRQGMEKR